VASVVITIGISFSIKDFARQRSQPGLIHIAISQLIATVLLLTRVHASNEPKPMKITPEKFLELAVEITAARIINEGIEIKKSTPTKDRVEILTHSISYLVVLMDLIDALRKTKHAPNYLIEPSDFFSSKN
jgi:hypothetical protein